jgi:hypothetical protein
MFETMTTRELKRRALSGIARNDNSDGAATYLIKLPKLKRISELRKSAIVESRTRCGTEEFRSPNHHRR